jgi:nucleoside 2-deoxyribosyltransferase
MKYYLASGLKNRARAQEVCARLREEGHQNVYDWASLPWPGDLEAEIRAEAAAIPECDVFILLTPYARGSATELGIAIASGKPIIIFLEGDRSHHDFADVFCDEVVGSLNGLVASLKTRELSC